MIEKRLFVWPVIRLANICLYYAINLQKYELCLLDNNQMYNLREIGVVQSSEHSDVLFQINKNHNKDESPKFADQCQTSETAKNDVKNKCSCIFF